MPPATSTRARGSASRSLSDIELASLVKAGMAYRDSHRFKEARDTFLTIRALCPGESNAEIGLGSICFSEGRFEDAIRHYRQALRLNPCNAYAYALLGESQIFHGECSAARVSLRRAREIDGTGPYRRLAQHLLHLLDSLPAAESPSQDRQP
jgi:Flp pilus assembly protein TadD